MPREHKVEHRNLMASLTDEELDAAIEAIQKMLATQAENAKVISHSSAQRNPPHHPSAPDQTHPDAKCDNFFGRLDTNPTFSILK
jgi:hypothetical protein